MYTAYEGIARLHGRDNVPALRVWSLVFALAIVSLTFWAGRARLATGRSHRRGRLRLRAVLRLPCVQRHGAARRAPADARAPRRGRPRRAGDEARAGLALAPRIVPGSVEALLGDLDRERPEIVVDAGSIMMARPMRAYDAPAAWLRAHYGFELRLGSFGVYRRKADGAACALSYFPAPHDASDWNGRKLPVPIARVVDHDTARRLPPGSEIKSLWFPAGPKPRPEGILAMRDKNLEEDEREAAQDGFVIPDIEIDENTAPPTKSP